MLRGRLYHENRHEKVCVCGCVCLCNCVYMHVFVFATWCVCFSKTVHNCFDGLTTLLTFTCNMLSACSRRRVPFHVEKRWQGKTENRRGGGVAVDCALPLSSPSSASPLPTSSSSLSPPLHPQQTAPFSCTAKCSPRHHLRATLA